MIKTRNRPNCAAVAALALLPSALFGGVASAQDAPTPRQCGVTIDRSADASTFFVVRQELKNGECVCAVTTGPENQAASIEERIADLLEKRSCDEARSVVIAGAGLSSAVIGGVGGVIGLAGLVFALDDDEPQPVSP